MDPFGKIKLVVSGAADSTPCAPNIQEIAYTIGQIIAENDCILITGATTGIPLWAAKGAYENNGLVIGLSPARTKQEHLKVYRLPIDYHHAIVYTGFSYSGRNLLLTRTGDGVIFICGRMGTLNEFTIAFEDEKPMGVLVGSGGIETLMHDIIKEAHRGPGKIIWESDPKTLVSKMIDLIKAEEDTD
jgi:hypothetical protein